MRMHMMDRQMMMMWRGRRRGRGQRLLLQHVTLTIVGIAGLQIRLHLVQTDAATAEQIGSGIFAIAIIQVQVRPMVARRGVPHQHRRRQMPIEMAALLLVLLLLVLRFANEEDDDARDSSRRRAYIIASSSILQRIVVEKRGEGHTNQHRHRLDAPYEACKAEVKRDISSD